MKSALRLITLASLLAFTGILTSCSISNRRAGVANNWRVVRSSNFVKGQTTEQQVLTLLGPPSRVIALSDRTCYYHVLEHDYTVGLNLIVFRNSDTEITYDRAVFFFKDHKLEQFSFSSEVLERD